jgi:hypothetical protein
VTGRFGTAPAVALAVGALAVVAVACSSGADLDGPDGALTGVCPDPLVVQADWYPLVEQGGLYSLLDRGRQEVDADSGVVRSRMVVDGVDQGVVLEIRSGGRATAHADVPLLMHDDPEVLIGLVATDQQLRTGQRYPTVGVMTLLERDPVAVLWDPATYDVERIVDLPPDTEVSLFGPGLIAEHLVDAGVVDRSQLSFTHTGRPDRFVDAGGAFAFQGFAADSYLYEQLVDDWAMPLRYQLLDDTGWRPYAEVLAVTPSALTEWAGCLEVLVPIVQRSMAGFWADPGDVLGHIRSLLDRYDDGWVYSRGQAEWIVEHYLDVGIMGPSSDGVIGGFDLDRIDAFLDRASGLLGRNDHVTADDLATDRFLDPTVRVRTGPG